MPWIPEEEIKRAREITAIEYLKKYQPNRLINGTIKMYKKSKIKMYN